MQTAPHTTVPLQIRPWWARFPANSEVQGRAHQLRLVSPDTGTGAPMIAEAAAWPIEQIWAHPDDTAFEGRIAEVIEMVSAQVAALPQRLGAGPLGCSTARNVIELRQHGLPDRAWRLAARLIERGTDDAPVRQETLDLSVSAYRLAVHEGGCVLAALEGAAVIDRLLAGAEAMALDYPGLGLQGAALAAHLRHRRAALLERAVAGAGAAPGSKASTDALMSRAPWLPRPRG